MHIAGVILMNVGEYIKSLRLKYGLTQEELGAKVGVKRAAVQKWECGLTQNLKRTTIQKLSDVFGVSPSLFINADISEDNNISIIHRGRRKDKADLLILSQSISHLHTQIRDVSQYQQIVLLQCLHL